MSLFLSISPSGFPPGSESWPRFLNHSGYRCEGRTPTAALTHPSPALCALFTPQGPRQTPCFASDPPNISGLCTYLSICLECPPLICSGDKLPVAHLLHPFIVGWKLNEERQERQGAWHLALPGTAAIIRIITPWDMRNGAGGPNLFLLSLFSNGRLRVWDMICWQEVRGEQSEDLNPFCAAWSPPALPHLQPHKKTAFWVDFLYPALAVPSSPLL